MSSLFLLFFLPFALSLGAFLFKPSRKVAIMAGVLPLFLLLLQHSHWLGLNISFSWFAPLSVAFSLAIDAPTLLFLYLTAFIIPAALYLAPEDDDRYLFYGLVFALEWLLFGFFMAQDLALFIVFWEAMLFPLYFILCLKGEGDRHKTAFTFLLFMFSGSVFMIAGAIALYLSSGTLDLGSLSSSTALSPWISLAFLLAFAVKTPLFPLHSWLPVTYFKAPFSGTILLAALLSKAGIYGLFRLHSIVILPLAPWQPLLLTLALAGVFYGAFAAWREADFKRLLAYTSFSHVNFILAGLMVERSLAHTGALLQAFNHGVTITALFLVAWWLKERLGTTSFPSWGGYGALFPRLCWLTLFFILSAVALPGTNNFIGEIAILLGIFQSAPWHAAFLAASVIFSVVYLLRWMQKLYFGTGALASESAADITKTEMVIALPFILLILWLGFYPMAILQHFK